MIVVDILYIVYNNNSTLVGFEFKSEFVSISGEVTLEEKVYDKDVIERAVINNIIYILRS